MFQVIAHSVSRLSLACEDDGGSCQLSTQMESLNLRAPALLGNSAASSPQLGTLIPVRTVGQPILQRHVEHWGAFHARL